MRYRILLLVAAGLGCGSGTEPVDTTPTGTTDLHTVAISYLDSAINVMKNRAFYRRRVNWDSVRATAHIQAAGAISFAGTYPAIRQALRAPGDRHSFFVDPIATAAASATAVERVDSLTAVLLSGRYALVHVPTFSGLVPGSNPVSLADTLQSLIRILDTNNPCGWIVDLRRNGGGNMWPMLAGIGPLLGDDERVGHFIDADSVITTWFYSNGSSGTSVRGQRGVAVSTSRPAYVLRRPNSPIAVLTDSLTASSGEAIAVAFRGLSRARSFGGATAGVPTANAGFMMPDGAQIFLMVALDADRNMTWYSDRIQPDEPISLRTFPATDDAVVTGAINWLSSRDGCKTP